MKRVVKVAFPYAPDGQNTKMTTAGDELDFPDAIVPGLEAAGLIHGGAPPREEEPKVEVRVEVQVEPEAQTEVKIEAAPAVAPIAIPSDWRAMKWGALRALAEKVGGRAVDNPKAALAVIEAELAARAAK